MSKILFTGGSTLSISGAWQSGDPFTDATSISATIEFVGCTPKKHPHTCKVTTEGERAFEVYVSSVDTETWPKGIHRVRLRRTDADFFGNGDPLVEVLEPFLIEVR